jgi:hypothetical protein
MSPEYFVILLINNKRSMHQVSQSLGTQPSVPKFLATKKYPDETFNKQEGRFFDESHYDRIFRKDVDVYYRDPASPTKYKILVKLRRNVIPDKMKSVIRSTFEKHAMRKNDQRAKASGGKRYTTDNGITKSDVLVRSNIVGYYDKPKMTHKKHFKTETVCRTTAFTKNNFDSWEKSIPFFEIISKYYRTLAPYEYKLQQAAIRNSPFRIGKTPFTTVTVNYNWRTACHKDKGDFSNGMGNLVVLGENIKGGYLGFPQFKIAVDVQPGDLIIMNVHEWHCNTEFLKDSLGKSGSNMVRLSFVCYMRENMVDCDKKKVIDGEVMYFKSGD